jgi:RES domain
VAWFRHCDSRWPFLSETEAQRPGRWHGAGEGPVHYLADTPDGAWAEFLRYEEIATADDLLGIARALWAVDVGDEEHGAVSPSLPVAELVGSLPSYGTCQQEARRLRRAGAEALIAPSAALLVAAARGQTVRGGVLVEAQSREGRVLAVFGRRPDFRGWCCVRQGQPGERLLGLVRHF